MTTSTQPVAKHEVEDQGSALVENCPVANASITKLDPSHDMAINHRALLELAMAMAPPLDAPRYRDRDRSWFLQASFFFPTDLKHAHLGDFSDKNILTKLCQCGFIPFRPHIYAAVREQVFELPVRQRVPPHLQMRLDKKYESIKIPRLRSDARRTVQNPSRG